MFWEIGIISGNGGGGGSSGEDDDGSESGYVADIFITGSGKAQDPKEETYNAHDDKKLAAAEPSLCLNSSDSGCVIWAAGTAVTRLAKPAIKMKLEKRIVRSERSTVVV